jgi:hypothetical protein
MGPRSATDGAPPCLSLVPYLERAKAKPICLLDRSAPWVVPSPLAVGCCALIWSYCLVHVSEDVNCYLPF